jgi:hypothetical protein
MPFNLLLLPLLGGFILISQCNRWKYNSLRLDGYRLLIHASIAGVFLYGLATVLVYLLGKPLSGIDVLWHQIVPLKDSGKSALALLLGFVGWGFLNLIFKAEPENDRAAQAKGDPLELLLRKALREIRPILLTVKNGKIYLGLVTHNSSTAVQVESVKILPFRSGYRDPATRRLVFTTDYTTIYEKILEKDDLVAHVNTDDFEIVIPYREIESANLFDPEIYKTFFADRALKDTSQNILPDLSDIKKYLPE